jgi:hypothetical protein
MFRVSSRLRKTDAIIQLQKLQQRESRENLGPGRETEHVYLPLLTV